MTSFLRSDRSRAVAVWLLAITVLVVAMVVVGGATRLTDSGLSITRWKPVAGVVPPLSQADWQAEFAQYRQIPQFRLLNPHMELAQFKSIYWWEWSHRLLGRVTGLVFLGPFIWFAVRREIPRRLLLRLGGLFALGALQGLVGWWMVASGLQDRVSVAPERLMIHLGLAFLLLGALIWTALDAWAGGARQTLPSPWGRRALGMAGLIYVQILLGALVAGNDAGRIYTDWPLMNGAFLPKDYAGPTLWATVAHSQAAVQLHHRLWAYLLACMAVVVVVGVRRSRYLAGESRVLGMAMSAAIFLQAGLGIATLLAGAPLWLAILHQLAAVVTLGLAVAFAWRVRRV